MSSSLCPAWVKFTAALVVAMASTCAQASVQLRGDCSYTVRGGSLLRHGRGAARLVEAARHFTRGVCLPERSMKALLLAACILSMIDSARAGAYAEVRISHVTITADTVSGPFFEERDTEQIFRVDQGFDVFAERFEFDLVAGGTLQTEYEYTITVFDGGLPFTPPPGGLDYYCLQRPFGECFYTSGRELAIANLLVVGIDPRAVPPVIEGSFNQEMTLVSSHGLLTQSGTLSAYIHNNWTAPVAINYVVHAELAAFSVPEPSTWALMLAGMAIGALLTVRSKCRDRQPRMERPLD